MGSGSQAAEPGRDTPATVVARQPLPPKASANKFQLSLCRFTVLDGGKARMHDWPNAVT